MRFIFSIIAFFTFVYINAQPLKREMRGAWLTTFLNIDWPVRTQTPLEQRESLISILNTYHTVGINTVYLQVRSQCDAMYPSEIEPWSADLTGVQGMAPFPLWDPLAFAIEECHKRALEIHAWINPYRAIANTANLPNFAPSHVARKHPEWLLNNGTLRTLDPGLPEVREYITRIIKDLVNRYDLDGIHFDDYFYPEGYVNDEATFVKYSNGFINKGDWRRNNVNLLIKNLGQEINALKPWMKFGISPSGIYRNSSDPLLGSPTNGLEHYNTLFSDTRKWLQEGWIDYLIPQVYYSSRQTNAPYATVVKWWQQHTYNRHIYIGIGTYKIGNGEVAWNNRSETPNQIRLNRTFKNIKGQSFYNTASIMTNRLGLKDSLINLFNPVALPPEMLWKVSERPSAPLDFSVLKNEKMLMLNWRRPDFSNELNKPKYYIIYRSANSVIDTNDPLQILSVTADTFFNDIIDDHTYYYAVSSLNRTFNESGISETITGSNRKVPVTYVLNWILEKDHEVKLRWKDLGMDTVAKFELEKSMDGFHYQSFKIILVEKPLDEYVVNDIISNNVFYRLKSVNINGQSSTGKPLKIIFRKTALSKNDSLKPALITNAQLVKRTPSLNSDSVILMAIKKDTLPNVNSVERNVLIGPLNGVRTGVNININIKVAGNLVYRVFQGDRQLTWGKIKTGRSNVTLALPGTNELSPGKYLLKMEMDEKKQEIPFELR